MPINIKKKKIKSTYFFQKYIFFQLEILLIFHFAFLISGLPISLCLDRCEGALVIYASPYRCGACDSHERPARKMDRMRYVIY